MSSILRPGILLGVLCAAWTFVMGFTGWYKDPVLGLLFFLVIAIEIVVLVFGLKKTAAEGKRYWGQVGAGTMIAVVGGVIVIGSSLLFTMVAFPEYFDEIRRMQAELLRAAGKSEEEIRSAVDAAAARMTPMSQAIQGFIGTVVTGCIASLVIGAFVRHRS